MKYYDYEKVQNLVKAKIHGIAKIELGMKEDWFWTGQTVWKHGQFIDGFGKFTNGVETLGGINGSDWATPIMRIRLLSGTVVEYDCYYEK